MLYVGAQTQFSVYGDESRRDLLKSEALSKLHVPVGLDICGDTPELIAVRSSLKYKA